MASQLAGILLFRVGVIVESLHELTSPGEILLVLQILPSHVNISYPMNKSLPLRKSLLSRCGVIRSLARQSLLSTIPRCRYRESTSSKRHHVHTAL